MDRRAFAKVMAGAAMGASAPLVLKADGGLPTPTPAMPFPLSVMLWTVFTGQPFEDRLAKVAQAGYSNIELVGEYSKGPEGIFAKPSGGGRGLGVALVGGAG